MTIYNKQMEPQMKVPQDSSTGLWKIDIRKEAHFRSNHIQQLKFNRALSITPLPTSQHIFNVRTACNTKVQLSKFYHKDAFSPSISTFIIAINIGHFSTWTNLTANTIQKNLPKTTATSKGHFGQVYQNIQSNKNFRPPEFSIIEKYNESEKN